MVMFAYKSVCYYPSCTAVLVACVCIEASKGQDAVGLLHRTGLEQYHTPTALSNNNILIERERERGTENDCGQMSVSQHAISSDSISFECLSKVFTTADAVSDVALA